MSPLLPFLLSLIVGILSASMVVLFDTKQRALPAILGLTLVCLGVLASVYVEMGHLKEDVQSEVEHSVPVLKSTVWSAVVKDIADYDRHEPDSKFNDILEDPVRKNIQTAFASATNGTVAVDDQADVVRITSELMGKASDSILATSYIDPKDWWSSDLGENYFNVIVDATRHVQRFDRLFIIGSSEEGRLLTPVLVRQQRIGLDVRYVCASNLAASLRRDFIVIDNAVGAELSLNNDRHFVRATFYSTHEEAKNLERVYKDLSIYAKIFDPKKTITCPPYAVASDIAPSTKPGSRHQ